MTDKQYECPACHFCYARKQDVLKHFHEALGGRGQNPLAHRQWAEKQGISIVDTLSGGPKDEDGIPSGNLTLLKGKLYKYLDD